ncbi:MAG: protein kinase [Chroococcus sp. CMT-3BRIN-NPC107]|jgi:serine/threonine-protein kinase|nr:protein kinase [Chroococcus sp. CMT-3BRIN-NPC107]
MTTLNGRYQIIQVLGHGGFGETFLAEDTYLPSRRRCVIKQLKVISNPQINQAGQKKFQQERFGREAATLEKLGEGNDQIPKLFAYFAENEEFYLIQEWIQGPTLTDVVTAAESISEPDVKNILVSLLSVLDYVHSGGIIHRDIKPDNIILRNLNNQPVLIDFGAVKETVATVINAQGKSDRSIVVGTPGFMAPEQAAGRPIYASDLYSLGLTAIYMLTGKHPQQLDLDSETGEILWHKYATNVSPALTSVLDRAINYHPRDRYTTAKKMLEAIKAINVPIVLPTLAPIAVAPINSDAPTVLSPSTNVKEGANLSKLTDQKNLIVGVLVTGLLGMAAMLGFGQNQVPNPLDTPAPNSSATETRSPVSTPQKVFPSSSPTPTPIFSPSVTPEAPTLSPSPTPEVLIPSPSPSPTPISSPSPTPANNKVVGFPPGTPESRVKAALGNPKVNTRGIWGNTRAVIYELEPERITLGYLYDRNSGQIRQTEVAFAQSVESEVMAATLQGMLGDRFSENINSGLEQVRQRKTNSYSFNTGSLKGTIERNNRDRIYIGVWEADLH